MALGCLLPLPAIAQIHPAANATNTTVTVNGQQFDIGGGAFSRDGKNLFHLFRQFGLNDGQIANFLSKPNVQNILAGVNGGDVSYINGLIQVMGGNSNLYLLNPAGIVFGPNAQLNVPAAFHASTAQRVHFDGGIFDINGFNDYANLVGNPTGFEFLSTGIIVNEGNLAVGPGQNLTLMGHQVFNTGTLSAPGGRITIQAVPETGMVRISQEGMILSLEIPADRIPEDGVIEAVDLPRLITGGEDRPRVNSVVHNADGTISLVHDPSKVNVPVEGATTVASGTMDVSNPEGVGGQINVLGSNVAFVNAQLNASGGAGGGTILGGGDYLGGSAGTGRLDSSFNAQNLFVDSNTVMNVDAVTQGNGGTVINWADNSTIFQGMISARGGDLGGDGGFVEVSGKKYLHFDGQVNTLAPQGQAGMLLLDPQDLTISTGANSGVPNAPNVLFTDNGTNNSVLNTATLNAATTNVTLQATRDIRFNNPVSLANSGVSLTAQAGRDIYLDANITTNGGDVSLLAGPTSGYGSFDPNGMIRRTGTGTPVRTIRTNGGDIVLNAASIDLPNRDLNTSNGSNDAGSITVTSTVGNITLRNLAAGASLAGATADNVGNGGTITVNSAAAITTGAITANSSRTGGGSGNAGNAASVTLTAQGNVTTTAISTNSQRTQGGAGHAGNAGNLTITTQTGNIQVGAINASSNRANAGIGGAGLGGIISLTTANGNITTQAINTWTNSTTGAASDGGSISLTTQTSGNNISTGALNSRSTVSAATNNHNAGNAGDITFSSAGSLTTAGITANSSRTGAGAGDAGNAGNLTITTQTGNIQVGAINVSSNRANAGIGDAGLGGIISLTTANGNINTQAINTSSASATGAANNGGAISLTTQTSGNIASTGALNSGSTVSAGTNNHDAGNAGNITLNSAGNLNTTGITANSSRTGGGSGNAGNAAPINLSAAGTITTAAITANSNRTGAGGGNAGNAAPVTLTAQGNVTTTAISTNSQRTQGGAGNAGDAGNLTIATQTGNIQVGAINASSNRPTTGIGNAGLGGIISLTTANGNINTQAINTSSVSATGAANNGGAISLTTQTSGNIASTGALNSGSTVSTGINNHNAGNAGSIALNSAGSLNTAAITANSSRTGGGSGNAGNAAPINLSAAGTITTAAITANSNRTGAGGGNAGNAAPVTLTAQGNVTTTAISTNSQRTQGGAGNAGDAGNLAITTQTGNIQVGAINANSSRINAGIGNANLGGSVSLTTNGNITTQGINTSSSSATGTASSGGIISLTAGNSLTISSGSILSGDNLTLIANEMALNNGAVNAGTHQVTVRPFSNGHEIDLGTKTAGKLSLVSAELNKITAGILQIGDTNSGSIEISALLSPTNTNTLQLVTGQGINQTAGANLAIANLGLIAQGNVELENPGNAIATLAGNTTGAISYRDSGGFTIGTVGTTNGLTSQGAITLNAGGAVTQTQPVVAQGLAFSGNVSFTFDHTGNTVQTFASDATGDIEFVNSGTLIIGQVNPTGVTGANSVNIRTQSGNLILNEPVQAQNSITLVTPSSFINNAGANGIESTVGDWLVYSFSPASNSKGGLVGAEQFNTVYPDPATFTGNGFLYQIDPSQLNPNTVLPDPSSSESTAISPTPTPSSSVPSATASSPVTSTSFEASPQVDVVPNDPDTNGPSDIATILQGQESASNDEEVVCDLDSEAEGAGGTFNDLTPEQWAAMLDALDCP
ncbi:filamentous hemagglutinin N-terminal domain-containing protein [Candidatus Synechococcus calcipolaris G9]|uniref:Filamentous hemagglutinin N-terminal domain-containing protein n=1 Tax=Candidatus Synechococcus calcipolaris G9 TaxID=1497997 RepID=A0ABT6EZL2_9SYNE|nr:filamentous hemagglutinin N-terminal domain-containing protein [Candidatus Synechococcus calcipolaris]MDG2991045.1 filamentous hemagglutinin N-terminal domain-containing protein [Candidatus Synechococcus calcipolaris G9]